MMNCRISFLISKATFLPVSETRGRSHGVTALVAGLLALV